MSMKYIVLVFGLGCFFLHLGSCGPSVLCKEREQFYFALINGIITDKKEDKIGGRVYQHFIVKNYNDSIYDVNWIWYEDYYDSVKIGDKITKNDSSLLCEITRKDSTIKKINFGRGCSYETNIIELDENMMNTKK